MFPLFLSLASFALISPCPSLPNGHFVVVVVVGVHDEIIFAECQKRTENKRKTQKLGWLREPDRSVKGNAPGIGFFRGSLPFPDRVQS